MLAHPITRMAALLLLASTALVSGPVPVEAAPEFAADIIATGIDESHSVRAADFDGDGDMDVVATDYVDGAVFWFRNDGAGTFVTQTLDANLPGAYPVHVADVDRDGDADVLAAGYLADTVAWYENDGSAGFTKRVVDSGSGADGAHSVVTGDMDGDGDIDLLTTNQDGNQVAWYRNDGSENFGSALVIDSYPLMLAKRAEFVDMDDDGDMDVVAASFGEPPVPSGEVAWYENNGSEAFTKHVLISSATFEGVYSVFAADFDKDGDQDVVAVSQNDNAVALFTNDGSEVFGTQLIDAAAMGARTVRVADVDGDGWEDLLVASVDDDTVAWHRNDQVGGFVKIPIDTAADGAYGIYAADMDQDGDLDLLSAGRDSGQIKVYYQLGAPVPAGADSVVLVEPGGLWHIRRPGLADYTFYFGAPGDVPLFGDWDGDGVDTPAAWRPGAGGGLAYMTNTLPPDGGVGVGEFDFYFGIPGDQVFSGDWNGDGADSLGVNRGGRIFLTNANGSGGGPVATDHDFYFGVPGDRAFGGDGDGDGEDGVFVYRESSGLVYYTNSTPASGVASTAADFFFGIASDRFVAGDWDADGTDTAAIFRGSNTTVYWSNTNPSGGAAAPTDGSHVWGSPGWIPVAGTTGPP